MRTLAVWLGLLLVVAAGHSALAGGCPMCKSSADCAGGFCVLYGAPIGCGTQLQTCCPGQACRIDTNGRPSCENDHTCTVVGGGVDGGVSVDSGVTVDASAAADAAATGDGGGKSGTSSGCSCRTGAGAGAGGGGQAMVGLGLVLGLGWRRRRR